MEKIERKKNQYGIAKIKAWNWVERTNEWWWWCSSPVDVSGQNNRFGFLRYFFFEIPFKSNVMENVPLMSNVLKTYNKNTSWSEI